MFSHQHRKEPNFIRLLQVDGLKPIDYAIDGVGVKNSFKRGYESSDFNGVSCTLFRTYKKSLTNKIFSPTTQFPKKTKKMAFFAGNYALKALGFLCGCA